MYEGTYKLIGSELSMFTRKLEAQLIFQKIPFQWRFKTAEDTQAIEARAGTRFIPLLDTPDGWLINDTIAIGPMLNDRFSEMPVIPSDPTQRALCFILEDFYNHWLPRHALHSRWCYPESVIAAGKGFGANIILGKSQDDMRSPEEEKSIETMGDFMRDSFGMSACKIQGAGEDQIEAAQGDFQEIMRLLEAHFKHSRFLLGNRPCLADFALIGTSKAHFLLDPAPRQWLGDKLVMLDSYVNRVWEDDFSDQAWGEQYEVPDTLIDILEHMKNNYQVFSQTSIEAAAKNQKTFTLDLGYGEFSARAMKRMDKSRLHVQNELNKVKGISDKLRASDVLKFYEIPPMI